MGQRVRHLEKKPWKNLTGSERDMVNKKQHLQDEMNALQDADRMWFETEEEAQPRFQQAIAAHASVVAERRRIEEAEEIERAKLEKEQKIERTYLQEQQAMEQKRLA